MEKPFPRWMKIAVALLAIAFILWFAFGCAAFDNALGVGDPSATGAEPGAVVTGVGAVLPPPWNVIATGVGGAASLLGTAYVAWRRGQKPAKVIIESIENAKQHSPEFKAAFQAAKGFIAQVQAESPRTERLVAKHIGE